jgi:hypothetical protein
MPRMEFARALKVAIVIGVVIAAVWLFREDRLCRAEIEQRIGATEVIEHPIGSQRYNVVPKSGAAFWKRGDPFPIAVQCWTDMRGISGFSQH